MLKEQHLVKSEKLNINGITYIYGREEGHNLEYAIYIPEDCSKDTTLLVRACNTGSKSAIHLNDARKIAEESTYSNNSGIVYASELKMPLLIPIIPRVQGYYTQALGSNIYNNNLNYLINYNKNKKSEDKMTDQEIRELSDECYDIPNQLLSIINEAKEELKSYNIIVDDKVIIEGYSAGSKFANLFTALHPEIIKACICGGNSGLGIVPLAKLNGVTLNYPLGVADIKEFDLEKFKNIPQYYYIGREDYNDPAMYACEYEKDENNQYKKDEKGNLIPKKNKNGIIIPLLKDGKLLPKYPENYSEEEINIIHSLFGIDSQSRFDRNKKIYDNLGINARFNKFDGNHNTVTMKMENNKYVINESIKVFIKEVLAKDIKKEKNVQPEKVLVKKEPNGYFDSEKISLIIGFIGLLAFMVFYTTFKG